MPWKAGASLPGGYTLLERVDLVRNRAHLKRVVCLSVGLAGAALLAGFCFAPAGGNAGTVTVGSFIVKLLTAAAGLALYMAGHEAVHGLAMWVAGRVKPHFGFTLMYAYAGSDAFFQKTPICASRWRLRPYGALGLRLVARLFRPIGFGWYMRRRCLISPVPRAIFTWRLGCCACPAACWCATRARP